MGEKGIKWLNEIKIIVPFCYSRGSPGRNNLLYYTKRKGKQLGAWGRGGEEHHLLGGGLGSSFLA